MSPNRSNLQNCLEAVRQCDCFLGIIRSAYGSGIAGKLSITHEECLEAVRREKPRWFLVEQSVTTARRLLRPYMFRKNGQRTKFKLKKNPVIDDLRVIDLYHDVIRNSVPLAERKGHWAQEYSRIEDALRHIEFQFKDTESVRRICKEMLKP